MKGVVTMMSQVQAAHVAQLRRMISAADLLAQSIPYAADAAQKDADALPALHALASKAQTYADALQSAAYDLIDPETAEDDGALFALHLSAVAAADRLANTIRNA